MWGTYHVPTEFKLILIFWARIQGTFHHENVPEFDEKCAFEIKICTYSSKKAFHSREINCLTAKTVCLYYTAIFCKFNNII